MNVSTKQCIHTKLYYIYTIQYYIHTILYYIYTKGFFSLNCAVLGVWLPQAGLLARLELSGYFSLMVNTGRYTSDLGVAVAAVT